MSMAMRNNGEWRVFCALTKYFQQIYILYFLYTVIHTSYWLVRPIKKMHVFVLQISINPDAIYSHWRNRTLRVSDQQIKLQKLIICKCKYSQFHCAPLVLQKIHREKWKTNTNKNKMQFRSSLILDQVPSVSIRGKNVRIRENRDTN
jgi:hypothetical protein